MKLIKTINYHLDAIAQSKTMKQKIASSIYCFLDEIHYQLWRRGINYFNRMLDSTKDKVEKFINL